VGFVAVGIALVIGVTVGACAGFFRGWVDILIMRFIEVMMCFPTFFLIITIIAFLPRSIFTIMVVIGVTGWMGAARIIRGEFLKLRNQEFVVAADALGVRGWRIIFRHMLPNAMAPIIVDATLLVGYFIILEAALSFLGLGIKPPMTSWGLLLTKLREVQTFKHYPWLIIPAGFIIVSVLCFNFVGDALRDVSDPYSK